MQRIILKAAKTDRYFIQLASVWYLKQSKKYEGVINIVELGKERARYGASEIRIYSENKETIFRQIADIAKIYPPKTDITVMYYGEVDG